MIEMGSRVSPRLWENIAPKLKAARDQLGCPVPQYRAHAVGIRRRADAPRATRCMRLEPQAG
jgi:hypothetical protein